MRAILAVIAMVLSLLPTTSSVAGFIGVSWDGDVYSINELTGSGSLIGASGWSQLNSMALDPSGRFLSATRGTSSRIVELDPVTGEGTLFHAPFLDDIRAMAYSPDGILYAIQDVGGVQSHLYMLDLSVPFGDRDVATFIGQSTIGDIQGLTFAPEGTLYAWSLSSGLITMNPDTAEATDVNGKNDGMPGIATLAFAPDGTLYGVHDALYTLDIMTGERSLVGMGGYGDVRGFEWIPSPGTLMVFALAGAFRRHRRRNCGRSV